MQENPMHVFIAMGVIMAMIVTMVVVAMFETKDAHKIDEKSRDTDGQQLPNTVHLAS